LDVRSTSRSRVHAPRRVTGRRETQSPSPLHCGRRDSAEHSFCATFVIMLHKPQLAHNGKGSPFNRSNAGQLHTRNSWKIHPFGPVNSTNVGSRGGQVRSDGDPHHGLWLAGVLAVSPWVALAGEDGAALEGAARTRGQDR